MRGSESGKLLVISSWDLRFETLAQAAATACPITGDQYKYLTNRLPPTTTTTMFDAGEKVVCVDDRFHPEIAYLFTALPVKGTTYTIRDCEMGRNQWVSAQKGWDSVDMKVLLVELTNPLDPSTLKGCHSELGFAARRFAPLESITHTEEARISELIPAG